MKRSLYALKQYPTQWYKRFDSLIVSIRYIQSVYDCCLYHKICDNDIWVYLLLYIDDMLLPPRTYLRLVNESFVKWGVGNEGFGQSQEDF